MLIYQLLQKADEFWKNFKIVEIIIEGFSLTLLIEANTVRVTSITRRRTDFVAGTVQ